MMRRTLASPMPVPSNCSAVCSRWKTPKSLSTDRISKPTPLSRTQSSTSSSCVWAPTSMSAWARGRVYFTALPSRLRNTWRSSAGSAMTALRLGFELPADLLHERSQVHAGLTKLRAAHPGKREEVIDQHAALLRGVGDGAQMAPGHVVQDGTRAPLQQLGEADDVAQRSAQIVRDRIAERFQFLVGLLELGGALAHARLQSRVELADLLLGPAQVLADSPLLVDVRVGSEPLDDAAP